MAPKLISVKGMGNVADIQAFIDGSCHAAFILRRGKVPQFAVIKDL